MSRPDRDWSLATAKLQLVEFQCRACRPGIAKRAHIVGRVHDYTVPVWSSWPVLDDGVKFDDYPGCVPWRPGLVWPHRIIPLCADCHRAQHAGQLDILPLLTVREQVQAVADCRGILSAYHRTTSGQAGPDEPVAADGDLLGGI